jgi:transposase
MTNVNVFTGFDVSKDSIDFFSIDGSGKSGGQKVAYTREGLKSLSRKVPLGSHCVLEVTGPYHLKLATWLYQQGYAVSVVNPLVIKRFTQMRLVRTKTDKADAQMIASYAQTERPPLWQPPAKYMVQLKQMETTLEMCVGNRTAYSNELEAFEATGMVDPSVRSLLKKSIEQINKMIQALEKKMEEIIENEHNAMMKNLTSIPGVGKKTAIALIVATGGFTRFDSHKKLSAYLGLCPRIYESGSSVRGKARICKLGMSRIRAMLYLCSWSAMKSNKACKELFDRLLEKGKAKKLALIAVANKLLRQAFAIAKKGVQYQPI